MTTAPSTPRRSAREATPPVQMFASSPNDPRARRAVDALRLVLQALAVVAAALFSRIAADIDRQVTDVLTTLPGFLKIVWLTGFWGAAAWSLVLVVATACRHRIHLTMAALTGAVLAVGMAALAGAIVASHGLDVVNSIVDNDGPAVFPPAALAVTSAVLAAMSPYLTLPLRRFGRTLLVLQVVGAMCLGMSMAFGVLAAVFIGTMVGSVVHLAWGSPAGVPTVTRVELALADLGVVVHRLAPVAIGHEGVAVLEGTDAEGPIRVKVYGRDALEGQFLVSAWRRVWFREAQHHAHLRRSEYVEHEGFMSSLAERAGVRVPVVVDNLRFRNEREWVSASLLEAHLTCSASVVSSSDPVEHHAVARGGWTSGWTTSVVERAVGRDLGEGV